MFEAAFSLIKRTLGTTVRAKLGGRVLEVLLKTTVYNLRRSVRY